jgi:K+-sensing histidine kinase KdpD
LTPVSVGEIVAHAARRAGCDLPVARPAQADLVLGDPMLLERACFNIADNANRHAGGLAAVAVEVSDGRVLARLDDRGPGIPTAERSRIFERFATHRAGGSSSGTGLGLALVAEAVTTHGGTVQYTDADSTGARFVIDLPAWRGS